MKGRLVASPPPSAKVLMRVGTKLKNIRLCGGDHDIDCKIPGFGGMKLKTSVVKKA
jgi:protein PhnA